MDWKISNRTDPTTRAIADRHYNRQKIGSTGFVPPGRCLVLLSNTEDAFWVTSYPHKEYVLHQWAGAFVCSAFRNEGSILSSTLVTQALQCTRWKWEPPELGMITFVDPTKVRKKRDYGRCFIKAGFIRVGETKGGLIALQMKPEDMPEAQPPVGAVDIKSLYTWIG